MWYVASPRSLAAAASAVPVSAFPSMNVKLFFATPNASSKPACVIVTGPSRGLAWGGSWIPRTTSVRSSPEGVVRDSFPPTLTSCASA